MRLDDAKKTFEEIMKRYGLTFGTYLEEVKEGIVKFVTITLRIKID